MKLNNKKLSDWLWHPNANWSDICMAVHDICVGMAVTWYWESEEDRQDAISTATVKILIIIKDKKYKPKLKRSPLAYFSTVASNCYYWINRNQKKKHMISIEELEEM
jgi:hypothetical protein